MIEQMGGRKFVFAMLLVVCFGMFVFFGKITVEQFISGALWAMGIFSGANAVQKIGSSKVPF